MTVAEIDALLYLPGHPAQQVRRALAIPALSEGWKASFRELPASRTAAKAGQRRAGRREPAARLAGVPPAGGDGDRAGEPVGDLAAAGRPAGAALPAASPGQVLTARLPPQPDPAAAAAHLLAAGPPDAGSYRISVKREQHGAASQFVHDHVRPGDQLAVAAPRGTFILRPDAAPVLLVSAGVGATPVLAMLHALADAGSGREVWWLHGARSRAEEPFAAEVRSLLDKLPRAHLHVCYSRPGADDVLGRDYQSAGRLSGAVLADLGLPREAEAYICGPAGFMTDVAAALAKLGLGGGQIMTEIFGARPGADARDRGGGRGAAAPAGRVAGYRP